MIIQQWIDAASKRLEAAGIPTARLDAEIILAHTFKQPRTYLHAHGDEPLEPRVVEIANARIDLRSDRTPIAYIIGHKEFYGRRFVVDPSVLIPRPESEAAIEILNNLIPKTTPLIEQHDILVDVGTGSGVLGITAKLEHPELDVHLTDISAHALTIAKKNADIHKTDVQLHRSDLLTHFAYKARYIIANLPYVDENWTDTSPELRHEPASALYASRSGLALIYSLLDQCRTSLLPDGYALIEADPTQHHDIIQYAKAQSLRHIQTQGYYVVLQA